MEKDKNKKMAILGLMLLLHGIIIPCAILGVGTFFQTGIIYLFIGPPIAGLWILIFVRIYVKKINKLKQEIDAS